jgi:hypothetical protein
MGLLFFVKLAKSKNIFTFQTLFARGGTYSLRYKKSITAKPSNYKQ